jgi:hypothetical protein
MTDQELAQRALEVLSGPPYFNVATESNGQPWNSPVWAARDDELKLYWSSWIKAVHSVNLAVNPRAFLTIFDSTRKRGTNNRRCVYLQCTVAEVVDRAEASKAFALLYPDEPIDLVDFLAPGQKRFYRATPPESLAQLLVRARARPVHDEDARRGAARLAETSTVTSDRRKRPTPDFDPVHPVRLLADIRAYRQNAPEETLSRATHPRKTHGDPSWA